MFLLWKLEKVFWKVVGMGWGDYVFEENEDEEN